MDWKLEVVIVPVTDVDRAKAFYLDRAGFVLDVDHKAENFRVVQLTPPGSACSITLMEQPERAGQLQGTHLVVADIVAARAELVERGAEVSELFHFADGAQKPGPAPQRGKFETFMTFSDPDGNSWMVQEVPAE
jgi:catechol 2,3-dioxygenase-like lactoylglutathione lyase family enzyme